MEKPQSLLFEFRLDACYESLTKAEKLVANYMKENLDVICEQSIQEIAALSKTGPATVVRFCRHCGFDGLSELKLSLKRGEIILARSSDINILPEDPVAVIKQKVLSYHESVVVNLKSQHNEDALESAASAMLAAKRIVVSGAGDSSAMAVILNNNLDMQGWETYYTNDPIQELAHISRLSKGDVLVGFSYSGRFKRIITNFKLAQQLGVTTIGILGVKSGTAEKYLDIILYANAEQKEYYFGSQKSLINDYTIVEILTTILAARRPFQQEHTKMMHTLIEAHRFQKENNASVPELLTDE